MLLAEVVIKQGGLVLVLTGLLICAPIVAAVRWRQRRG